MMGKAFAVSRITTAPVLVFVILQWNPLPAQAELEEELRTRERFLKGLVKSGQRSIDESSEAMKAFLLEMREK